MSLFVGNIAGEISQKELEDLFNKYGKCEIKHKNIFAFVEYSSDKEAEQAKQELNKKEINGRVLSIEWSKKSKNYASKRYRDSGRCYTCGRRGHFARDCPERRSDSYHRYRDRSYRSRSRSGKYRSRRRYNNRYDSSSSSRSRNSRSRDNKYRRRSRSRKRSDDSYYNDRDRYRDR